MSETTYTYHETGGHQEALDASDMDEAFEMAEDLCREGSWGDNGAAIDFFVTEEIDGEETDRRSGTVEIEPDHEALISRVTRWCGRSCGDSPDDHDWTAEGDGGCDENPGVWSTGGTSL